MKPLISIVTPVYNVSLYIEQTIRSVLNQTYRNWEWIILDDGSTDGTGDFVRRCKDSRIRYYYQGHAGLSHLAETYNKALQKCSGEFIAMLDGDDYWPNYKLETQVDVFEVPDVVLTYGICCLVNHKGKEISKTAIPVNKSIACNSPVGSALKQLFFVRESFIPNPTVMTRRSSLVNIGGFVDAEGLYQDFPTWTRLALEGTFVPLQLCLGYYRRHRSSLTLNSDQERYFHNRVRFIMEFALQHKEQLSELDIVVDSEKLEKRWEEIGNNLNPFLPYNRAMLMLRLGAFKDAAGFFRKFSIKNPSLKHHFMLFLFMISKILRYDIVHPVENLKKTLEKFVNN